MMFDGLLTEFPGETGDFPMQIRISGAEKRMRKVGQSGPVKSFAENYAKYESDIDRNIDSSGKIQLLELINGLGSGLNNVDESLVGALLKLIHGLLVDVRGAIDTDLLNQGWQWNRTGHPRSGALGGVDDF